jgi:hypothetical protein
MALRVAIAVAVLALSPVGAIAGIHCPPLHVVNPAAGSVLIFTPEATSAEGTSIRGLSLGLSREAALNAVSQLEYSIAFPSSDRNIDFCVGKDVVGSMRFTEENQLIKLELRPAYFGGGKVVLREFADRVFDYYGVRPTAANDDVCFSDVTCFRGTTSKGEKFLILRIGMDIMLHVSR